MCYAELRHICPFSITARKEFGEGVRLASKAERSECPNKSSHHGTLTLRVFGASVINMGPWRHIFGVFPSSSGSSYRTELAKANLWVIRQRGCGQFDGHSWIARGDLRGGARQRAYHVRGGKAVASASN